MKGRGKTSDHERETERHQIMKETSDHERERERYQIMKENEKVLRSYHEKREGKGIKPCT